MLQISKEGGGEPFEAEEIALKGWKKVTE